VSEAAGGRREQRKAQTRAEIRAVAQRLFAEHGFDGVTSADVAAEAGVAVQTVFNHFGSKEDLFFDGRTPWVEGLAAAVENREPGTDPLTAVRRYLIEDIEALLEQESRPDNRSYIEVLASSPTLQARERSLVEIASSRLADALLAAIPEDSYAAVAQRADPVKAELLSRLGASLFLVAGRVLVLGHRQVVLDPAADETSRRSVVEVTTAALATLEDSLRSLARQQFGRPGD
jgi:AcrR family transcriptional regulator